MRTRVKSLNPQSQSSINPHHSKQGLRSRKYISILRGDPPSFGLGQKVVMLAETTHSQMALIQILVYRLKGKSGPHLETHPNNVRASQGSPDIVSARIEN
jgi:hypothetical protein